MRAAPGLAGTSRPFRPDRDATEWRGRYVPYDLVKEFVIALVVVVVLVVGLAVLFGSPDDKPITVQSWSNANQVDFLQTAITELDGTSATATYGPPYNTAGSGQQLGPLQLQQWAGVHHPIDTAQEYVLGPLSTVSGDDALDRALAQYRSATPEQQTAWTDAYEKAAADAKVINGSVRVQPVGDGPVGTMMTSLVGMARSGALDGAIQSTPQFTRTNYTAPLLFVADGTYLENLARAQNLGGDQWGMMNETNGYPGQAWLWLYTLWYQVPAIGNSDNADIYVFALMIGLTTLLALVPFIPGLRSIPRWSRLYRLIWRSYYREIESTRLAASPTPT